MIQNPVAEKIAQKVAEKAAEIITKQDSGAKIPSSTIAPTNSAVIAKSESPLASTVSNSIQPGTNALAIEVTKASAQTEVKSFTVAVTDIASGEVVTQSVVADQLTNQVSVPGVKPGNEYVVAVLATSNQGRNEIVSTSRVVIAPNPLEKPQPITSKTNNAGTGTFSKIQLQPKAGQAQGNSVKVTFNGLKPGQQLRVTVIEGK